MSRIVLTRLAPTVFFALLAACATADDVPVLALSASPRNLPEIGGSSEVSVETKDEKGLPGSGTVTLTVTAGAFEDGSQTTMVSLADGKGSVSYTCLRSTDPLCVGTLRIDGQWNGVTSRLTLFVGSGATPDGGGNGGTADGGTGDGGTGDGGSGNGGTPDGGAGDAGGAAVSLTFTAAKNPVFHNVGDTTVLTALVTNLDGGPRAGEAVDFTTTLGDISLLDGGSLGSSVRETTNASGSAQVRYIEDVAGTANLTAMHVPTGVSKPLALGISSVQQVTWMTTKCAGTDCTIMGLKGSGFNEQAQVTFRALDASANPVNGVKVTFSLSGAPTGTTVSAEGTTDAMGRVTANVSSGLDIGVFSVRAVVIAGTAQADSPNIGIRGAKASNQGFRLQCSAVNLAAHVSPSPPNVLSSSCTVVLVDRYNNPVGTGASVSFKTEAGTVPPSTSTTSYNPTMPNSPNEGRGTISFSTMGTYPAVETEPFAADPAQYPYARVAEPKVMDGALERNPRDGLVTILAYVRGEEHFFDDNRNGIRDSNERFIDQGEAFVDANDNNVWDPGETYIDDSPSDMQWNGPNGVYDADKTIWTEARILYTGRPVPASPNSSIETELPFFAGCPGGVAKGTSIFWGAYFGDLNLNVPQSAGTTYSVKHSATKGAVSIGSTAQLDGYGFDIERILVNAATNTACNASTPICQWRTLFKDWRYYSTTGTISGAALTDTTPCTPDTVTVESTVLTVKISPFINGSIQ